jgi:predicted DNA-binding antitoxin AbrB/MazE fold protein
MPLTFEAIYENGVLKPVGPLPLQEQERVTVTIQPKLNWVQETYGILGWKGTPEELRRLALHPDLDLEEEP